MAIKPMSFITALSVMAFGVESWLYLKDQRLINGPIRCSCWDVPPSVMNLALIMQHSRNLDLATLPFYLKEALKEEKRGYPNYDWVDKILAWCKEKGIRTKGHPLWWNHVASTPEWLMDVDWETMKKECIRTVKRSVERYRNDIQIWDVVNEVHDWSNLNPISQDQMIR